MSTTEPVLLTGGTGFAGTHLIEALLTAGYNNIHVTTLFDPPPLIYQHIAADHIHKLDLTAVDAVGALLSKLQPKHLYQLAANAAVGQSYTDPAAVIQQNTQIEATILEAIRQKTSHTRFLSVSSAMVYDTSAAEYREHLKPLSETHPFGPTNPYGVSKVATEMLALSYFYTYNIDVVRVRPFNHIGEYQTTAFAVPHFAEQIAAIEVGRVTQLRVGNLQSFRDFTDVKDMARAYILLMEHGQSGDVYNVGTGVATQMQTVIDVLCSLSSQKIDVVVDETKLRPSDQQKVVANNDKICALGWQAQIPLEATLERVLHEWRIRQQTQ